MRDIAQGSLILDNKNLKDLTGFDVQHIPGLNKLRFLYLGGNQLVCIARRHLLWSESATKTLSR